MKIFDKLFRRQQPDNQAESTDAPDPQLVKNEQDVLARFESTFKIRFRSPDLLLTALRHRSYLQASQKERIESNERLEFLGDAVLNMIVTDFLYHTFPDRSEGELSKDKSILVSKPVIADEANLVALGDFILMNRGEEKTGGRQRKSIIADAFEAIVGAIFIDQGLDAARNFVYKYLLDHYPNIVKKGIYKNYKSVLLEYAQSQSDHHLPEYRLVEETGPDHAKHFVIEVWLNGQSLGSGDGRSKKAAEQEAAKAAIRHLNLDAPKLESE